MRVSEYELNPSSIHASSNSLLATIPYQNWCPASWIVTPSGDPVGGGESQRVPPVKNVGYSMPPVRDWNAGSTTVTWSYG